MKETNSPELVRQAIRLRAAIASMPDTMKAGDEVAIPRELFDFLMGTGEIEGTSFGDLNDGLPGRFWWRALLRTAERTQTKKD